MNLLLGVEWYSSLFRGGFFIGSTQKSIIRSMKTNEKYDLEKYKELVLCGSAFDSDLH